MTFESNDTPAFSIPYYPDLIPALHRDHEIIQQKTQRIKDLIAGEKFLQITQELESFRTIVLEHVSQENLKLYIYLQHSLKDQPTAYAEMRLLRKNMDQILLQLMNFLEKYKHVGSDPQLKETIATAFSGICIMYNNRIRIEEEKLFPTYQPMPEH